MSDKLGPCPEIYTTIRTKMINEEYVAWLEFALEEAIELLQEKIDNGKCVTEWYEKAFTLCEAIKTMEGK